MTRRHVDVMYDDYLNQLVPDEARGTLVPSVWSYAYNYVACYFKVPHPYMTPDTPGDPPRPLHREMIL